MQKLSTDEIGKSYKGRQVVRSVSLEISQGEVVGLLGPNGAGKTTSFYMIVGLVTPDAGRILADGADITRVPMYMRARQYGISYLPQEPSVFRKLTVEENILAVLEVQSISPEMRRACMLRWRRLTKPTLKICGTQCYALDQGTLGSKSRCFSQKTRFVQDRS